MSDVPLAWQGQRGHRGDLTQRVIKLILHKSIPPQICQLIISITNIKHESTDLCRNGFLQNDFENTLREIHRSPFVGKSDGRGKISPKVDKPAGN